MCFLPQNQVFCEEYNNNGTKKHFNYAFFTNMILVLIKNILTSKFKSCKKAFMALDVF